MYTTCVWSSPYYDTTYYNINYSRRSGDLQRLLRGEAHQGGLAGRPIVLCYTQVILYYIILYYIILYYMI